MRNLTPHPLVIFPPNAPPRVRVEGDRFFHPDTGEEIRPLVVIPPDPAGPLRMEEINEEGDPVRIGDVEVPVTLRLFRVPELPREGGDIIVSLPVAQAWAHIHGAVSGVYVPDTGSGAVRDERGNIVGTRRLIRVIG
jgi:hypothetical protein